MKGAEPISDLEKRSASKYRMAMNKPKVWVPDVIIPRKNPRSRSHRNVFWARISGLKLEESIISYQIIKTRNDTGGRL